MDYLSSADGKVSFVFDARISLSHRLEDGEQEWEGFFLFDARISLSHRPYQTWIAFYEDGWPTRILQFSVYTRYRRYSLSLPLVWPLSLYRACSGKDGETCRWVLASAVQCKERQLQRD